MAQFYFGWGTTFSFIHPLFQADWVHPIIVGAGEQKNLDLIKKYGIKPAQEV
jgi:hypothetical protein